MNIATLPTEFKGICWSAGWEFDMPVISYFPFKMYRISNNSFAFDSMVEEFCLDLANGDVPPASFTESELREFKLRGWSWRNFHRRKRAWHILIEVNYWFIDSVLYWDYSRKESWGPFPS